MRCEGAPGIRAGAEAPRCVLASSMSRLQLWQILALGFVLVLIGFALPFLMVVRIIPSSLILSFISYAASVIGLFLGLIGAALYVRTYRKR